MNRRSTPSQRPDGLTGERLQVPPCSYHHWSSEALQSRIVQWSCESMMYVAGATECQNHAVRITLVNKLESHSSCFLLERIYQIQIEGLLRPSHLGLPPGLRILNNSRLLRHAKRCFKLALGLINQNQIRYFVSLEAVDTGPADRILAYLWVTEYHPALGLSVWTKRAHMLGQLPIGNHSSWPIGHIMIDGGQ